jgi:phage terminase large subunit-like protein
MSRDYCAIAQKYALNVISKKIPAGKHVIAACQRQLDDLKRWNTKDSPFLFDKRKANVVCEFIELLPHIKGPKSGQLIELEPWQIFILTTIFGWIRPDGYRRFRRAYVEVPRGNGKSAMSSGLSLYMLCADNEGGAEIYSFATTRQQAKIVFGDAQNMARRSPGLRAAFGVEINAHNINVLKSMSKFEALSAEGSTLDGLNTHFACIDELHAHKTRAVYDVVETSIGKRAQSLLWVITTAGSNRAGICYEVRSFVLKVLNRTATDESQFGIVYGLDDEDDWTKEHSLIKANPNWKISVMPEILVPLQTKAKDTASATNNFLTKHLNEWVNADSAWMQMRAWDACGDPTLNQEMFLGEPAWIALDLASKVDIAAKVAIHKRMINGEEHFYCFGQYYLPRETVDRGENSQYQGWEIEGLLTVTEGAVIDFAVIEDDLIQDCSRFEVVEIPYDPFQATQLSTRMMAQGLPMVEVRPSVLNFSEPMKQVEALVLQKRLHHNGDPAMTWMMSNVVAALDHKDNIYPRRERPENKIDGVVALIMAMGRAMQPNEGGDFEGFLDSPLNLKAENKWQHSSTRSGAGLGI